LNASHFPAADCVARLPQLLRVKTAAAGRIGAAGKTVSCQNEGIVYDFIWERQLYAS
jgi:hypothetical protein